jgi:hypothetical protein
MLMRALFYTLRMRPRVQRAPGIPCALFIFEGGKSPANLGRTRREIAKVCLFFENQITRHSGMRHLAQARNPYSRSWLWIL